MELQGISAEQDSTTISAQQEGAWVQITLESTGREDVLLTPHQARHLAAHLQELSNSAAEYTE